MPDASIAKLASITGKSVAQVQAAANKVNSGGGGGSTTPAAPAPAVPTTTKPLANGGSMSASDFINSLAGMNIIANTPENIANANKIAKMTYNPATGSYDTPTGVVTAKNLATPATPITVPTKPTYPENAANLLNSSVLTPQTKPTVDSQVTTPTSNSIEDWIKNLTGTTAEPTRIDRNAIMEQAGVNTIQQRVNNLANQIGSINAKLQSDLLQTRGTAAREGVTEAVYGGIQNELNREAAVKLMPLTALYQAESGNLTAAKELVANFIADENAYQDKMYNYRRDLGDKVWNYMTSKQQREWQLVDQANADRKEEAKTNNNFKNSLWEAALNAGMATTGSKILELDASSPTFMKDAASYASQIATTSLTKAPEVKTINGVDMQWNGSAWVPIAGGTSLDTSKTLSQFSFLRDTIKGAQGLANAAGPSVPAEIFRKGFSTATPAVQLAKKLDTLKVNLLTLATDPNIKKFFGPQMTEKDTELMTSAGTTMDAYANSPEDLKTELNRYDDLLNRMETAVKMGMEGTGENYITAPDGTLIKIID